MSKDLIIEGVKFTCKYKIDTSPGEINISPINGAWESYVNLHKAVFNVEEFTEDQLQDMWQEFNKGR